MKEHKIEIKELVLKSSKDLHTDTIKCLIYGDSGMGKTFLSSTLEHQKTLIISAESGLLSINDFNIDVLEVKKWNNITDIFKFIKSDKGAKYENIFIDSLSELSILLVNDLENSPEYKPANMGLKMWGEYSTRKSAFIRRFRDLDKNVIFTALSEDVNDNGTILKIPFIKGKATQKILMSFFDEVFHLKIDPIKQERVLQTQPTSQISAKDRSGKLDSEEEPNLTKIFNKIRGINND